MTRRDALGVWRSASTSARPPRKVVVGTVVQGFWGEFPGLAYRLAELSVLVGELGALSRRRLGRGLDLAVLPESVVNGEPGSDALAHAHPWRGPVADALGAAARRNRCYVVAGMNLLEDPRSKRCSNAAVLVDRRGRLAGIYRKMHPVPSLPGRPVALEGGMTAGRAAPVFRCDFGRLGLQICYDIEFDRGWNELARANAELVAWPSQSPQLARPAMRALKHGYFIVSSTWKRNASVFDPMGRIAAQVRAPGRLLVTEIDLSWALLGWSPTLRGGALLRERYGKRVGFRYHEDEDRGLFWSNDPRTPVARMARATGQVEWPVDHARSARLYGKPLDR